MRGRLGGARGVCVLALGLLPPLPQASGVLRSCGPDLAGFSLEGAVLRPDPPRINDNLTVQINARAWPSTPTLDTAALMAIVKVDYCQKYQECVQTFRDESTLCGLLDGAKSPCPVLHAGELFAATATWSLPRVIIRGTYEIKAEFYDATGERVACMRVEDVQLLGTTFWERLADYRDAIVAFVVAASASSKLGALFPRFSRGLLPQISGFLFIGIVVGPYCTNLVSQKDIFLIGDFINRFSLAFIGGAAGAELFLPEFVPILGPLGLQLLGIFSSTLLLCTVGLLVLDGSGLLVVTSLAVQSTFAARVVVALLCATLMTARSPASTLAVISELKCGHSMAAKVALGVTVLGDMFVLILFSLCCQLTRVVTAGSALSANGILGAFTSILSSIALGVVVGLCLRLVLPLSPQQPVPKETAEGQDEQGLPADFTRIASLALPERSLTPHVDLVEARFSYVDARPSLSQAHWLVDMAPSNSNGHAHHHARPHRYLRTAPGVIRHPTGAAGEAPAASPNMSGSPSQHMLASPTFLGPSPTAFQAPTSITPAAAPENADASEEDEDGEEGALVPGVRNRTFWFHGVLILLVLYAVFMVAEHLDKFTKGWVDPEPLMVCVVTSCIMGNDEGRRGSLLKALSFWTPHILLPFFTLAGASLNLQGVISTLPVAVTLVLLRMAGIAVGSMLAGVATQRAFPRASTSRTSICFTWMTMIAQAGVTMGLVLEIRSDRELSGWSGEFSTLILGVVVINQVVGPVMCRVGLTRMVKGEAKAAAGHGAGEDGSEEERESGAESG